MKYGSKIIANESFDEYVDRQISYHIIQKDKNRHYYKCDCNFYYRDGCCTHSVGVSILNKKLNAVERNSKYKYLYNKKEH